MISLIFILVIGSVIEAVTVGISAFAVFGRHLARINHWKVIILFTPIFAVLQIWYIPMIVALDISVFVGNKEVAEFFNLDGYVSLNEILNFGTFDFIACLIQAVVAYFFGLYVFQRRYTSTQSIKPNELT